MQSSYLLLLSSISIGVKKRGFLWMTQVSQTFVSVWDYYQKDWDAGYFYFWLFNETINDMGFICRNNMKKAIDQQSNPFQKKNALQCKILRI